MLVAVALSDLWPKEMEELKQIEFLQPPILLFHRSLLIFFTQTAFLQATFKLGHRLIILSTIKKNQPDPRLSQQQFAF